MVFIISACAPLFNYMLIAGRLGGGAIIALIASPMIRMLVDIVQPAFKLNRKSSSPAAVCDKDNPKQTELPSCHKYHLTNCSFSRRAWKGGFVDTSDPTRAKLLKSLCFTCRRRRRTSFVTALAHKFAFLMACNVLESGK